VDVEVDSKQKNS